MAEIRKASIEDLEVLATLFDNYRIFYKKASDLENARKFLFSRITNNESEIFICFSKENVAVGFVQLYPLFSSTRMRRLWLLNDLYVDEHHRGNGYSKKLIERAKELCKSTNACGLTLETSKENSIGNRLYPAAGSLLDNEHNYYSWDNTTTEST
ncbi:GNAT family N-acetyltransferase [Segetibacter aerophilus]|uniref:N-acetyltransferase n=1 Tax=Segetibacter aerophilus TaxID=670293 RepID=A0A512B767_9BACT|nr:GNAT family N-acetyltransferase [Segetibacter aerophilus]GEO07805.1 N-acetyltransferase [Segetibacter aerophilus]